ncbi:E3 ubiquitin-protein ligase MBR2-like [Phragmites australis]|uniref:E3 ubiquitin-protein ligase MBR2-like n=1 Tax=Phragmites australis TaxID=29695 RepID=UPI002D7A3A36|nr:E3 ubiquitin-protein ligase MBR2-like [Phragmites australis]
MDRRGGSPTAERRRGIRRLLLARGEASSYSPPPPPSPLPAEEGRVKGFASAALRGLGCTSAAASQAYAPGTGAGAAAAEVVRSSADWHGRRRRRGKERRKERGSGGGGGLVSGGIGADVWCAPGIPFTAEASSVDCVVTRHQMVGRGGRGGEGERSHRERPCLSRRVTVQEQISSSFMDSPPPHIDSPFFGAELIPSGRHRRMRGYRHSPGGLEEEIMIFQTRVLLGGMSVYDRYQDWRLDVDNMTYEELLELEDRIGYVNTGLREDEITRSLRKVKHPAFGSFRFAKEMERKCSICQEEFEANEEMGRLDCGHSYHVYCIKQWLSQKNTCPVCKTAVNKT